MKDAHPAEVREKTDVLHAEAAETIKVIHAAHVMGMERYRVGSAMEAGWKRKTDG
jgi:hypothetical protein